MKTFDHMSALQELLHIDTAIFKEELYYPWYIKPSGITALAVTWLFLVLLTIIGVAIFASSQLVNTLISVTLLSILIFIFYLFTYKKEKKVAQSHALTQIMNLEKKQFVENIRPFVADDQKYLAKRIAEHKDFTAKEYTSIALATQSRVLFNTEAFIKDIEQMFQETDLIFKPLTDDETYSETTFKVPAKAKKNYEKLKNQGTFNEVLDVPFEAKQAIVKRVQEAMNHAALGRNNYL